MVNKRFVVVLLVLVLLSTFVQAVENDCVYYFYADDCSSCEGVNKHISSLSEKYPDLNIQKYEVYKDAKNAAMLQNYYTTYGIPEKSQLIPVTFTSDTYFVGDEAIKGLLENHILDSDNPTCPSLDSKAVIGVVGPGYTSNVMETLTFFSVLGMAISDSVKPAHLALILLLMVILVGIKDEELMIKRAVLFLGTVYATHLLYGWGLFTGILNTQFHVAFYRTIGVVAALYGTLSVKAFFSSWNIIMATIPSEVKKNLKTFKSTLFSINGIFLIGFFGGILSLADLSPTFLTLQSLFQEATFKTATLPMIFYYSLLAIIPLIGVFVLTHFIRERLEDLAEDKAKDNKRKYLMWEKHHMKILRTSISGIMLVVGLILIFV